MSTVAHPVTGAPPVAPTGGTPVPGAPAIRSKARAEEPAAPDDNGRIGLSLVK